MAYDPTDGYDVLFGGEDDYGNVYNETWIFDDGQWSELHPPTSPPARSGASLAWDPTDGYLLLFGGGRFGLGPFMGDTWSFLGGVWTQVYPESSPSPREYAAAASDDTSGGVVLFGGLDDYGRFLNDTWRFSQGNWTELSEQSSPSPRWAASMAYNPVDREVVLFGGENISEPYGNVIDHGDTWVLSNGTWNNLHLNVSPAARAFASLAYLGAVGALVLFGGANDDSAPPGAFSDTWWLRGGNWSHQTSTNSPPPVADKPMAPANSQQSLLLFGGPATSGGISTNRTWEYYTVSLTLSASTAAGDAPLKVFFAASATGGVSPYAYNWTFSDGGNSSLANASSIFTSPGTFSASVTVNDTNGASALATTNVTVFPSVVLSAVATPLSGPAPLNVSFGAVASGGDPPYSYVWNTTVGPVAAVANGSFTFATPGTYALSLTLSDQFGPETSKVFSVDVSPPVIFPSPFASSIAANVSAGSAPFWVQFSSGLAGGVAPFQYAWEFGDGSTSALALPTHLFTTAGTFNVNLTVTDVQAVAAVSSVIITVHPSLSIAIAVSGIAGTAPSVTVSSVQGVAPFVVNFSASAVGGWSPYLIVWQFGDGSSAVAKNVSHDYSAAGTYVANAEVVDAIGARITSNPVTVSVAVHTGIPTESSSAGSVDGIDATALAIGAFAAGGIVVAILMGIRRQRARERS
jgi:PKD repeat protein